MPQPTLQIAPVSVETIPVIRDLFQEYWTSFGFTPCFQNFEAELENLPGAYAPPRGRLALATVDGEPAGCIALRPLDAARAEAKRLYVRSQYRGRGVGRELMEWVIGQARGAGYQELVGDTMPVMQDALAMYERMGFERTGPYTSAPTESAIYIRLRL